jgi:hypothetical protein
MKKTAAAAAGGLVTVAALTGAATQVGLATADSAAEHTKRYVVKEVASQQLSENRFAGSERIKSKRTREVVGYDSYNGKYYPAKDKVVAQVGIVLKGGVIVGRVHSSGNAFKGRILKGSGKYAGIEGTITRRDKGNDRAIVVLRYRL